MQPRRRPTAPTGRRAARGRPQPRTLDPARLATWRSWYAAALPLLTPPGRARSGLAWVSRRHFHILTAWLELARPTALRLAPAPGFDPVNPSPDSGDIAPRRVTLIRDEAGAWYALSPAPAAPTDRPWRRTKDSDGNEVLRPPTDLADRWPAGWRVHHLGDVKGRGRVYLHGLRSFTRSPRTGGRHRQGPRADVVVRALLVRGLMEDGMAHGAAVRQWLAWDRELGGQQSQRLPRRLLAAVERIAGRPRGSRHLGQLERDARLADRETWRSWESGKRREHRRLWQRIGIVAPDGSPVVQIVYHP